MASLASMNSTTLKQMIGREVSDAVVLIAKNMILGSNPEMIREVLGCSRAEIDELMESQDYKDVHLLMAAHYNSDSIGVDLSYDELEARALSGLMKRVESVKDTDQLIRIAQMANRAVRRQKPMQGELNPALAQGRVNLTLTRRMVEKLQSAGGPAQIETTEQISIHGAHTNPTFEEVDKFFGVRGINGGVVDHGAMHNSQIDPEPEDVSVEALERLIHGGRK